jgi:hypothetical protein
LKNYNSISQPAIGYSEGIVERIFSKLTIFAGFKESMSKFMNLLYDYISPPINITHHTVSGV